MKKLILMSAILFSACISFAQTQGKIRYEVVTGTAQPNQQEQVLMKQEEANHPNLTTAIHQLREAYTELQNAPNDFGGHKAQAMADTQAAVVSLRKALYYRLYIDHPAN